MLYIALWTQQLTHTYNSASGQKRNVSGFWSSVSFKIGPATRYLFYFFCQQGNTWYPHIQSMVAKRGLTNWANVHTPMRNGRLKQHGRIPIDPAILAATGHRFIAPPQKKKKNLKKKCWHAGLTHAETRNQSCCFFRVGGGGGGRYYQRYQIIIQSYINVKLVNVAIILENYSVWNINKYAHLQKVTGLLKVLSL